MVLHVSLAMNGINGMPLQKYIEDVSAEELAVMIKEDDELLFKHKDCAMGFSSDGSFLYAFDAENINPSDPEDNDLFRHHGVRFSDVVRDYYGDTDQLLVFLLAMRDVGLELGLSDMFNIDTLSIDEYVAEVKRFEENFK